MRNNFKDVEFLFPIKETFEIKRFIEKTPEEPFSKKAIEYLNALSVVLNKIPKVRAYPDVVTFAFFCRKANLYALREKYKLENSTNLGRGMVFHIAPSNVPVNFAYSLVAGILSGNTNIVRVPSKNFEQVNIICNAIQKLGADNRFQSFSSRIVLVKYERTSTATAFFSSVCDVRVIWGGDDTIAQIRENKIPPRAFDVTFADRYSLCAINADEYIGEQEPEKIALGFYNDTYLFDQNACTSPHLIIWLGKKKNIEISKEIFWSKLHELLKTVYVVQPVIAVDKLTSFYNQAMHVADIKKTVTEDNLIWRIELIELTKGIDEFRCTSGYFSEYSARSLFEIAEIVNQKYQTLCYYGIKKDELVQFINQNNVKGIDRIVPIGRTSDFSLTWDGYNLIDTLSRRVEIS